jgi:hypothetical protein
VVYSDGREHSDFLVHIEKDELAIRLRAVNLASAIGGKVYYYDEQGFLTRVFGRAINDTAWTH